MYALVFIVESVIRTGARVTAEKLYHFILVKIHLTTVAIVFLVVVVKNAGLTIDGALFVCGSFHIRLPPIGGEVYGLL